MSSDRDTSQLAVGGKLAWLGNELGLPQEIREGQASSLEMREG